MRELDQREGVFYFGGVSTTSLEESFGTPLYVYDRQVIQSKLQIITDDFLKKYPNTAAFYASKAFLCLEMARIIQKSSFGIDVASIGECFIAIEAGIEPDRILFHGNNKTMEELKYIVDHNIGRVVVDNVHELLLLDELTKTEKKKLNLLIRFSPKLRKIYTHKHIQTGHKTSKFGFDLETEMESIVSIMKENPYLRFLGLHFHVGSQLHTNANHLEAIDEVFLYIHRFHRDFGLRTMELNIGGGFGVYYNNADHPLPISEFLDPSMKKIRELSIQYNIKEPSVLIEPGRYIVSEAAITIYTVGNIKKRDGKNMLAINGGMTDNLRVALYDGRYEAIIANKSDSKLERFTIVGNVCESTDVMIEEASLSTPNPGDLLVVFSTGAYEQSLANNFNKMLRPAIVMIQDGTPKLIQRRETLKDLIQRDI